MSFAWDDAREPAALQLGLARHGVRTSIQEPYFVARQKKTTATGAADLARTRQELLALGKEFSSLLKSHERQEAALVDLRQKVRAMRQEGEAKDKQLDLAARTVDRLSSERVALESAAATDKALIRKMESRLLACKNAVELQSKCAELKSQLDVATHSLAEAEARARRAEERAQSQHQDTALLRRGIELAAEQLTRSAGAEVPTTLLMAVARGQEEAMSLSVQLADARQQAAQMASALEQARAHLQAQQQTVTQRESLCSELAQQLEAAQAALQKERTVTSELRRILDALRPKAGALAEERDGLRQRLEAERTIAAEAQDRVRRLEKKVRQHETVELALRGELRRVLAGEGQSPAPAPASVPAPAARHQHSQPQRHQQERQRGMLATSPAQVSRAKRGGGLGLQLQWAPRGASPGQQQRLASRRALHAAGSPAGHYHLVDSTSRSVATGSSGSEFSPAQASPTEAVLRLQHQRQQQQGSRLGMRREEEAQAWEEQGRGGEVQALLLASPPSTARASFSRPEEQPEEQQQQGYGMQTQPPAVGRGLTNPAAPASLPAQDRRLMSLYASALDDEIAELESDLAQLAGAASPVGHMQATARQAALAAAAVVAGSDGADRRQQQEQQQKKQRLAWSQAAGKDLPANGDFNQQAEGIGAWRPNAAYQHSALHDMQQAEMQQQWQQQRMGHADGQLFSPGPTESKADGGLRWHSNPLASSSPSRSAVRQPAEAQTARQIPADIVCLPESSHNGSGLSKAVLATEQVEQQQAVVRSAGSSCDGFVSQSHCQLVHDPSSHQSGSEPVAGAEASAVSLPISLAGGIAPVAMQQQQQQPSRSQSRAQETPASVGAAAHYRRLKVSLGGATPADRSDGGPASLASLSHQWTLPDAGPAGSDWLSSPFMEPDIEHLEISSSLKPPRPHQHAGAAHQQPPVSPGQQPSPRWQELLTDAGGQPADDDSGSSDWPERWETAEEAAGQEAAPLLLFEPAALPVLQKATARSLQVQHSPDSLPMGSLFDIANLNLDI